MVLVTGASGFIGSNLCKRLVQEGYNVNGIDVDPPKFDLPDSVEIQTLDLTEQPNMPEADVIIHLAARSQVQPIVENPDLAIENICSTKYVLDEANRMDAFVINASSRDVYGNMLHPSENEVSPDSPNGYAASKLGSEAMANAYRNTYDVPVTSLRLSNVFGPMDTNQRVIPIFIALAEAGEELTVFGRNKLLDFVYIRDVCDAILAAIRQPDIADGEAINIGSGVGTELTKVADEISKAIDSCPGYSVSNDRTGDVSRYVSDISKARDLLNYEPSFSFEEGLSETISWYRNHPEQLEFIRPI